MEHNILIIVKHGNQDAFEMAHTIQNWLTLQKVGFYTLSSHSVKEEIAHKSIQASAILVLGGDGTMLASARTLFPLGKPIFGMNFGRVGFLTEADPNYWEYWLQRLMKSLSPNPYDAIEPLMIEEHILFRCSIKRNNTIMHEAFAVNDAVIARGSIARAIGLSLFINKKHLSNLRCDGLILSTPLGATAYAISAHGPLAFPGLDAQIITPICPFAGAFPPCVVAGSTLVQVLIADSGSPSILTIDGQETFDLLPEDEISITAHSQKLKLFISNTSWYVERLVDRGFIRQGPGTYPINEKNEDSKWK